MTTINMDLCSYHIQKVSKWISLAAIQSLKRTLLENFIESLQLLQHDSIPLRCNDCLRHFKDFWVLHRRWLTESVICRSPSGLDLEGTATILQRL